MRCMGCLSDEGREDLKLGEGVLLLVAVAVCSRVLSCGFNSLSLEALPSVCSFECPRWIGCRIESNCEPVDWPVGLRSMSLSKYPLSSSTSVVLTWGMGWRNCSDIVVRTSGRGSACNDDVFVETEGW